MVAGAISTNGSGWARPTLRSSASFTLMRHWAGDGELGQASQRARVVTAKAWRFVGEMDEIAATFRSVGLPGEFHAAAGEVYRRLADFKESDALPELEAVLAALTAEG